jgi:hypothetical protein
MKIIHQNGFSRDELLSYRNIIYKNVLDSAQDIVMAMRKIGVDCQLPENRVRLSHFSPSPTLSPISGQCRSHLRVPPRTNTQLRLLRVHRGRHQTAVAGPHHPHRHGPQQRVLPNGQRSIVRTRVFSVVCSPPMSHP